jgi:hypothetical protein
MKRRSDVGKELLASYRQATALRPDVRERALRNL